MYENQEIGKKGEDIVCAYLEKQGYFILGKNIKTGYQELDIVAKDRQCLVFVEVKTRTQGSVKDILDCIDKRKMGFLKKAMNYYLEKIYTGNAREIRLDVAGVFIDKNKKIANISYFKEII